MEKLLKAILRPNCIFCKKSGKSFCNDCLAEIKFLDLPVCLVCQRLSPLGITHHTCLTQNSPTQIFSCFEYEGKVRECIARSKYKNMEFDALKDLTDFAIQRCFEAGVSFKDFVVVPVPLSKGRLKKRGFNHSEIIGKKLSKRFGLKFMPWSLKRVKETPALSQISRRGRVENLQDAFVVKGEVLRGKKVLLVDDIFTTGSTLLSSAKAIYGAGAVEVRCFTVCRVL